MSESTGAHTINSVDKGFQVNCAGKTLPGCSTKINNPDKDGNGEVSTLILNNGSISSHVAFLTNLFSLFRSSGSDPYGWKARLYGVPE